MGNSPQTVRRGSFANVEDLQQAIQEFLAAWNENPKPFVWTATVESIEEKLARCRQTLEQIQPGCHAAAQTAVQSIVQLILGHYTSEWTAQERLSIAAQQVRTGVLERDAGASMLREVTAFVLAQVVAQTVKHAREILRRLAIIERHELEQHVEREWHHGHTGPPSTATWMALVTACSKPAMFSTRSRCSSS